MIRGDELHWKDEKTAFIRAMAHESPQLKFPAGPVERGDAVRVNVHWDVCENRGAGKHRAIGKMVIRVKPISDLRNNAEIHLIETTDRLLDAEEYRRLWPILLNVSNERFPQERSVWLVRLMPETRDLAKRAAESADIVVSSRAEKLAAGMPGTPIMPPLSPPTPSWMAEEMPTYAEIVEPA